MTRVMVAPGRASPPACVDCEMTVPETYRRVVVFEMRQCSPWSASTLLALLAVRPTSLGTLTSAAVVGGRGRRGCLSPSHSGQGVVSGVGSRRLTRRVGAVVSTAEHRTEQDQDPKDPTEERQGMPSKEGPETVPGWLVGWRWWWPPALGWSIWWWPPGRLCWRLLCRRLSPALLWCRRVTRLLRSPAVGIHPPIWH